MTATNQQMTSEQLADLSTLAVQLQAKAEANDDRDTAVMAYAVQRACSELEESRREFTAANATIHNLELKMAQVVAENDRAVKAVTVFSNVTHDITEIICDELGQERVAEIVAAYNDLGNMPETDAYLAEVRTQAIRDALDASSDYLDTDCVMDRLDISYEDAELRTSGAIELHDALVAVATELREGAAK
ncbi:hypothetical protein ABHJ46_003269 [Shigella dysenteriae]|uniref:hypothetical protein n=1 Tax=Escherichia coli TaxID=562 RepID=UPI00322127FD